jgi:hypothetical protein
MTAFGPQSIGAGGSIRTNRVCPGGTERPRQRALDDEELAALLTNPPR